jgi:hypothetical protein
VRMFVRGPGEGCPDFRPAGDVFRHRSRPPAGRFAQSFLNG